VASVADSDYGIGFELYEMLPDAILAVDQQGVIRYANRQAGRMFGQEPATLVSTPVEALLPEQLRERHIAHRAKYNLEPRRRPMGRGLDLVARRADGTTFPVDIMLNPLTHLREPMTLAVVRDMTDRRAIEEALCQAQAAFETFYEQPPDATILVDENGKIDRVNAAAEAMFGFSRERMLGQAIEMLVPERIRDIHIAYRGHYMKDPKIRHLVRACSSSRNAPMARSFRSTSC
jgi:PAS domain S-box-containing protein